MWKVVELTPRRLYVYFAPGGCKRTRPKICSTRTVPSAIYIYSQGYLIIPNLFLHTSSVNHVLARETRYATLDGLPPPMRTRSVASRRDVNLTGRRFCKIEH